MGLQRGEAAADRVAHAVGQRQRALGGGAVVQAPLRGEQLDELVDEERVAGARLVDRRDELRRDRLGLAGAAQPAGARGGELADLVAAEALQRQPGGRAREAAERGGELGARVRLGVAVGGDRQQRDVGQRARDELERQQRGGIGPVQVVEHDDERLALGGGGQQRGERVEEPEARLVGVQLGGAGGLAERRGELGQQAGDPGRAGAERGGQRARSPPRGERAADLHPRPVGGRAAAVPAAAPRPRRAARGGVLDELARERGLADARLAGQQHEAAAAVQRGVEGRLELRKLAPAPHQARTSPVAQSCRMHSMLSPPGRIPDRFSVQRAGRRARRLPARRARAALERPAQLGGDPAAVEVAGLRLHALVAEPAGVHPARVERDVVAQAGVGRDRLGVRPGGARLTALAGDDVEIRGDPLPLTE